MAEHLKILVTLQDKFSGPFKRLSGSFPSFQKLALGAAAGVGAATTALFAMAKQTANSYDRMQKFSDQLGISTEFLSRMEYAAQLGGVRIETMNKATQMLQVRIGEFARDIGQAKDAFEGLGVQMYNTNGQLRTAEEIMPDLAEAFYRTTNATERAEAASKIFGQRGMAMLQLFKDGRAGLENYWKEAEKFGVVVSAKAGKSAAEFNDSLTRLKSAFIGIRNVIAENLLPLFTDAINRMSIWIAQNRQLIAAKTREWLKNTAEMLLAVGKALLWVDENITDKILQFFFGSKDLSKLEILEKGLKGLRERLAELQTQAKFVEAEAWIPGDTDKQLDIQIKKLNDLIKIREDEIRQLRERNRIVSEPAALPEVSQLPEVPPIKYEFAPVDTSAAKKETKDLLSALESEYDQYYLNQRNRLEKWNIVQAEAIEESKGTHAELINAKNVLDQVYAAKINELDKQEIEDKQQKIDAVTQAYAEQFEMQEEQLNAWYERQLELYAGFEEQLAQLREIYLARQADIDAKREQKRQALTQQGLKDTVTALKSFGKAGFRLSQAFEIAEATMAAQGAFVNTLKTAAKYFPPPIPMVLAAAAFAAAMARVAAIAAAKPPAAHGGLENVPREQTYLLDRGERVLSPIQNKDLTAFLDNVNAGGYPVNVTIEKLAILENATTFDALMQMSKNEMRDLVEEKIIEPLRELKLAGYKI